MSEGAKTEEAPKSKCHSGKKCHFHAIIEKILMTVHCDAAGIRRHEVNLFGHNYVFEVKFDNDHKDAEGGITVIDITITKDGKKILECRHEHHYDTSGNDAEDYGTRKEFTVAVHAPKDPAGEHALQFIAKSTNS